MKIKSKRSVPVTVDPKNGLNHFVVEPGEPFEVSDKVGQSLLEQPDRWELADDKADKSDKDKAPKKKPAAIINPEES